MYFCWHLFRHDTLMTFRFRHDMSSAKKKHLTTLAIYSEIISLIMRACPGARAFGFVIT